MGGGSYPLISSWEDVEILETFDYKTKKFLSSTFFYVTPEDTVYSAELSKDKMEVSLEECNSLLKRVDDEEIFPPVPSTVDLTIAPGHLNDTSAFVKRPGLLSYERQRGADFIPKQVINETLIMETLHKNPHPNIINYYGCRVRNGRITAILLERLEFALEEYALEPAFRHLDKNKFCEAVESAVAHLHSLGLAHNDISSNNIMVRDGKAVLIDFGSCQPVGKKLQSLGSPGWYEENFNTSEFKHDYFSLKKLREWFENKMEDQKEKKPQVSQQPKGIDEQFKGLAVGPNPSAVAAQ